MTVTRTQIFSVSLVETAAILVCSYLLINSWYPSLFFTLLDMGIKTAIFFLACVVLGPCLSALIYKKDKYQLVNDLSTVYALKLVAVFLALFLFYSQRPQLLVFAVDRLVVVQAHHLPKDDIPPNVASLIANADEPPLIAARLFSTDNLELMMKVMSGAPDIEFRPNLYEKIEFQKAKMKQSSAKWLTSERRAWLLANTSWSGESESLLPLPLAYGNERYGVAILDLRSETMKNVVDVNPW